MLRPGAHFGPYRVERPLAKGGQGAVYRAEGPAGPVALKLLHEAEGVAAKRFLQEGELLRRLEHRGLPRVYEVGPGPPPYMAMELIAGRDLKALIRERGPLSLERTLEILAQVARALDRCHALGVIHRDLKPANVLIEDGSERAVLVDFGLAKRDRDQLRITQLDESLSPLSRTGEVKGTPSYMPPEQIDPSFGEVGPRADVYGLAATAFFLLSGQPPFQGATPINVLNAVMNQAPRDLAALAEVPPAVARVIAQALSKASEDRPPSPSALVASLRAAEGQSPGRAAGALLLAGLLVAAGAAFALRGGPDSRSASSSQASPSASAQASPSASAPPSPSASEQASPSPSASAQASPSASAPPSPTASASSFATHLARARAARREGAWARAAEDYRAALEISPGQRGVLYELSQTYMFWGDQGGQAYYVKAKELSDRLVEQHPKWPQSWGQRGYVYSRLARTQRGLQAVAKVYDKACENWEKGYSLDPSYVNGLRGLANTRAQEAELYLKSGLRQQGIAAGRKSVAAFERALRAAAEQGTPEGERVSLRAGLERARRLAAGER